MVRRIRRRLRSYLCRQWQNGRSRFKELRQRGLPKFHAAIAAGSPTGFWRMSGHPAVQHPTGPAQLVFRRARSSPPLCSCPALTRSNRRGTDPYARWCGRGDAARRPPILVNARPTSSDMHRRTAANAPLTAHSAPSDSLASRSRSSGRAAPALAVVYNRRLPVLRFDFRKVAMRSVGRIAIAT